MNKIISQNKAGLGAKHDSSFIEIKSTEGSFVNGVTYISYDAMPNIALSS